LLRRCGAGAALLVAFAATRDASAQPAIALNRFDPAPAGDRFFGVQSPFAAGKATPHLMLLGDYAHNPLVVRWKGSGDSAGEVVSSQLFLHVNASFALFNRLNLNVNLPVALLQDGSSSSIGGATFASPSGAQIGDLRLGARFRIFGEYDDPFQIGVGGYVWVPTADSSAGSYVGNGSARGLPQAIVGGLVSHRFLYTVALGPELRADENYGDVKSGSMFRWGAGIGVLLLDNRHLQLGLESNGSVSFREVQKRNTNAELLAGIRYRIVDDFEVGAGAGPGLTTGIGTPDVRVVAMLAYTPEQKKEEPKPKPPSDRDGDGIFDEVDACPDQKGVADPDPKKNGCPPPPDRDGDGIIDALDACPDVPGVPDPDPKKNGCPPDRDGDGILDSVDACPDVKGVADPDPKKNGCPKPVDTDGDGIFDPDDACPNEKGPADPDPKKNGCPKAVRVTDKEIFILEQVQFDTGKSTIKPVSDPLLDEVAGVLKEHPEITKVEVQGHTDDRGAAAMNRKLSQDRAASVVAALVKRGIDKGRLTPKGYGPDKPIAPNTDEQGRQQNRRVQFTIVEKGEKPSASAPAPSTEKPAAEKPAPEKPAAEKKAPEKPAPKPAPEKK
jgi:outer membrane protein OmpA-like peptidoglycan-associated protein